MDFQAPSEHSVTLINQVWRAQPCSELAWPARARAAFTAAPGMWRARPHLRRHTTFTPTCRACWATPKQPEPAYVAASTDPTRLEE